MADSNGKAVAEHQLKMIEHLELEIELVKVGDENVDPVKLESLLGQIRADNETLTEHLNAADAVLDVQKEAQGSGTERNSSASTWTEAGYDAEGFPVEKGSATDVSEVVKTGQPVNGTLGTTTNAAGVSAVTGEPVVHGTPLEGETANTISSTGTNDTQEGTADGGRVEQSMVEDGFVDKAQDLTGDGKQVLDYVGSTEAVVETEQVGTPAASTTGNDLSTEPGLDGEHVLKNDDTEDKDVATQVPTPEVTTTKGELSSEEVQS